MATLQPAKTAPSATKTATNNIVGYDTNNGGKQVYVSAGYTPGISATKPVVGSSKPVVKNLTTLNNIVGATSGMASSAQLPTMTPITPTPTPTNNQPLGGANAGNLDALINDFKNKGYDASAIYNELNSHDYGLGNVNQQYINDYVQYGADFMKLSPDMQAKYKASQPIDITNTGSPEMQAALKYANDQAAGTYDPLIKAAQTEKEQGFAKATIGAGQVGGFMNTQFAGANANPEIQAKIDELQKLGVDITGAGAASDWAGVGGELSQVKSAYDSNIQNLQSQKAAYIEQMKQAYVEYQNTGKQTAYDNAVKLFEKSQAAAKQASDLETEKVTRLQTIASTAKTNQDVQTKQLETAAPELAKMSQAQLDQYAQQNGISKEAVYGQALNQQETNRQNELLNSKSTQDILSNTTTGGKFSMGGKDYTVLGGGGKAPATVSDGKNIYQQTYNNDTGKWEMKPTGLTDYGSQQKNETAAVTALNSAAKIMENPNWSSDPVQSAIVNNLLKAAGYSGPAAGATGDISSNVESQFPSGTKGGECVDYARNIVPTLPSGLYTLDDKKKIMNVDKSGVTSSPQVGDALVIDTGKTAGHVAVINKIMGNGQVQISESNWDLKGTINNNRVINVNDKNVLGAYRSDVATSLKKNENQDDQYTYGAFEHQLPATGQANFKKLPEADKANVMSLINGDALMSDIAKGMGGAAYAKKLLGMAKSVDPEFSENQNKQRNQFRTQWNNPNGKSFNARNSINTALGHLSELKKAGDALKNVSSDGWFGSELLTKKYNTIKNMIDNESGKPEVAQFQFIVTQLASEIASAYKGSSATDQETEKEYNAIAANFSPAQLNSVFDSASTLLASKIGSVGKEYQTVMGKYPDDPIVQSYVLDELKKAGVDTKKIEEINDNQLNEMTVNGVTYYRGKDGKFYQ